MTSATVSGLKDPRLLEIMEDFQDPNNLEKGLNRRIYYKSEENDYLVPAFQAYRQFQAGLSDPAVRSADVEAMGELFLLRTHLVELRERHWKLVETMELTDQQEEYESMKEQDERNLVSEAEITSLLERREALYQKLNDKLKYEQEMENVRKNPSREESNQRMDELNLQIEALQRQAQEHQTRLSERHSEIGQVLCTVQDLKESIASMSSIREALKRELKDPPASQKTLSRGASPSGAEEGEIKSPVPGSK